MRTKMVEVIHILLQDAPDRGPAHEQKMVQALAPDGAEESLAHHVGIRGGDRGFDNLDVGSSGYLGEGWTVLAVIVTDKIFGPITKRSCLPQLLGNPAVSRGSGDANMNHAS